MHHSGLNLRASLPLVTASCAIANLWMANPASSTPVEPDPLINRLQTVPSSVFLSQTPRPFEPLEPPPSQEPLPEPSPPEPDIPPDDVLETPTPTPAPPESELPLDGEIDTVTITRFEFEGNTAFTDEELAAVTADYTGREITLTELFEARSAVTQTYIDAGYVTSGAYIPPQPIQNGVVMMQIVEGSLDEIIVRHPEEIQVQSHERLNDRYITSRVAIAADTPLNVNDLLEALQLLQLDPRIETLRSELAAGTRLGSSTLTVDVAEASTFDVTLELDNRRSPSVGSFRQEIELSSLNFAGNGEAINLSYARTRGSNSFNGGLDFFVNPRNGVVSLSGGLSSSEVVETPFDELNLESESYFVELAYRQPIIRTLEQEFALGIAASHQQNRSVFDLPDPFGDIPVTLFGADEDGEVRVTALRLFQDWTRRAERQVFAVRSQLSIGLDVLEPTINTDGRADSRFVAWRGQAQWVRRLAEDTLLLVRGDIQLADDDLLTLEQFGLGGQSTIRGYRQDLLLTDNGVLASAEVRIPIARTPRVNGLLQVIPFLDIGKGWNVNTDDPDPSTLVGAGIGLLWQMDRLSARLDWGIPIVDVDTRDDRSLQEDGIYFSLIINPF